MHNPNPVLCCECIAAECVKPLHHERNLRHGLNLRHVVSSTLCSNNAFLVRGFEGSKVIYGEEIEIIDDFYLQKMSFNMFVHHDM